MSAVTHGLGGIWAAVPTPWAGGTRIDADVLEAIVARYAAAGLDGCYTTGTDGEFHAMELDVYERLADAFRQAVRTVGIPSQMGISAVSQSGILARAAVAEQLGFTHVQTTIPGWETLGDDEVGFFFDALADAAPGLFVVHYNIAKVGRLLEGPDYARIRTRVPALVGTKLTGTDPELVLSCVTHAPAMAHHVVDGSILPGALLGASGVYSAIANVNPDWAVGLWRAVQIGDWPEVARRRALLYAFKSRWRPILAGVTATSSIAHAFARCGIAPEIRLAVQPPYRTATADQVTQLRKVIESEFPELAYAP